MRRYSRAAFVIVLLAFTVTACKKKPVVDPVVPTTGTQTPPPGGRVNTPPADNTPSRVDSASLIAAIKRNEGWVAEPVYFAYDMAELSTEARSNLDQKIAVLRANASVRIRIEGHADERGSDEYNIALGQRRAAASRAYLEARGIAANRIETVSLGEEKPAMPGSNESAWSKNRRDEFVIIAGRIDNPIGD